MKIYQPMLFVGLGGTGLLVGTELERRLRAELCGPDGTLIAKPERRAPFQLPDCVQFVYADFSENELNRLPHLTAPQTLRAAYGRTARATHDLLPTLNSSSEVTQRLRVSMHEEVRDWLPPRTGEPRVAPLSNGAGQLPTVGRAALFATLQHGLEPVLGPLNRAIDAIARSGADLQELGGNDTQSCDVFVAFSVAGGTGAGIFFDYLHLIGHAFKSNSIKAKIYPLVVMPSAFPPGQGGGRNAQLNAGRAVIDLFRLVDDQNRGDVNYRLGEEDESRISVRYPGVRPISLDPSTVQTGFLFSRTAGIRPDDLRRSMVSLVTSLLGTELGDDGGRGQAGEDYQSFASSFVNKGTARTARSASGIGQRGVSTSLVASLTVPVNELAELVAGRLLAGAVRQLAEPRPNEDNAELVHRMFVESDIDPVWTRHPRELSGDPNPLPRGSTAITAELSDRVEDMQQALGELDREVAGLMPELARDFNPRKGLLTLAKEHDYFRLDRVVNGIRVEAEQDPRAANRTSRVGFRGMLENRRTEPDRPAGVSIDPPRTLPLRGRLLGARHRWGDPEVVETLDGQYEWYRWRSRKIWHRRWADHANRWRRTLDDFSHELAATVDAFMAYSMGEPDLFRERTRELYRDRTGVSYLLPPQGNLKFFYDDVIKRLLRAAGLPETQDEAGLVLALIAPAQWAQAYDLGARDPRAPLAHIKGLLEQRVKSLFTEAGGAGERPLLPSLGDLLTAAAGDDGAASAVSQEARQQFGSQLVGLLPGGFTPDGTGPLKILIVYPRTQAQDRAEAYLLRELRLPRESKYDLEFRGVSTDAITVVLLRSDMSLSEVPEVRQVLQTWAGALHDENEEDCLSWRQRFGWDGGWLASDEPDRQHILHRLLCALWNGQVDVLGDLRSPRRIRVRLRGDDRATMTLPLQGYDRELSSWASLLHAYEEWALLDPEPITEDFSRQLTKVQPIGIEQSPVPPAEIFSTLVWDVAPGQLRLLDRLQHELGPDAEDWLGPVRQFWTRTLPGALNMRFPLVRRPVRPNLRDLDAGFGRGVEGATRPAPPANAGRSANAGPPADTAPPADERWSEPAYRPRAEQPEPETNGWRAPAARTWPDDRPAAKDRPDDRPAATGWRDDGPAATAANGDEAGGPGEEPERPARTGRRYTAPEARRPAVDHEWPEVRRPAADHEWDEGH